MHYIDTTIYYCYSNNNMNINQRFSEWHYTISNNLLFFILINHLIYLILL